MRTADSPLEEEGYSVPQNGRQRWRQSRYGGKMDYRNSEMKVDQLIGYFNEKKINLIPPFQRGHVWKLKARQELMKNIVAGRPIPAIFLYKDAAGSRYNYNILDGKQRLESLLLFVGSKHADLKVEEVRDYFYGKVRGDVNFEITHSGKKVAFAIFLPMWSATFVNTRFRQSK